MARRSIPAIFMEQVAKLKARPMVYGKRDRHWRPLTWAQMGTRVTHAAAGLISLGIESGEPVAILADSGPEWVLADLAILSAGAAVVPIYETSTPAQAAWVLDHAQCRLVFVHTVEQMIKLLSVRDQLPRLEHVVHFDERILLGANAPVVPPDLRVMSLLALEALGCEHSDPSAVEDRIAAIKSDDLLTIIYTSGTTGTPKGVMLTHANMIADCEGTGQALSLNPSDVILSFLPLSHAFERMSVGYMALLFQGATVYFAEGMGRLIQNMGEVKPTVMTGVPRVYEKIYARFMARLRRSGHVQRVVSRWALEVGRRVSSAREAGRSVHPLWQAQYKVAGEQVFARLRERLGGRLRFMVSGGAPLAPEIAAFFHAAGVLILEGYGLTETSPVVTVNRLDSYRFGTVGLPLSNVRIRLAPDNEIMVKGPNVMRGYYKDPAATAAVLSPDGWLATGDVGELDTDGFLRITDRKKDLFKTAGGKYIAPQLLEGLLRARPLIDQAIVIGDTRPYCVALIVPDISAVQAIAEARRLDWRGPADLVRLKAVHKALVAEVDAVNVQLGRHEQIRAFKVLSTPFSEAAGLLTASQKTKRRAVIQRYAALVEALYTQQPGRLRRG
ncbi:MAG: long-chain acyl-CoA synthetase [Bradymonadia bacterium]|jgi:long-chain acyl-CoA synthetase